MNKLFAVYLGGKAKGAKIEVHDIAFVTGKDIKATFPALKKQWFGDKKTVHVDSWAELSEVEGHKIALTKIPAQGPKLFFVNVGSYRNGIFGEQHHYDFLVCDSKEEARARAKRLYEGQLPHIDNLKDVDDILQLSKVGGYHLELTKTTKPKPLEITNVYWPIK